MAKTLISVCDRCGSRQPLPDQAGNFGSDGWFRNALGEICHGCSDGVIGSPEYKEPGAVVPIEASPPLRPQTEFAILGPSKIVEGATSILMRGGPAGDNHPTAGLFLDGWVYGFIPYARQEIAEVEAGVRLECWSPVVPAPASIQYHDIRVPEDGGLYRRIGEGFRKGKKVLLAADADAKIQESYDKCFSPALESARTLVQSPIPPSSFVEKLRKAIENVKNNAKTGEKSWKVA